MYHNRNYVQVAMMKRFGRAQTVFRDRRLRRDNEKIDWFMENVTDECDIDDESFSMEDE